MSGIVGIMNRDGRAVDAGLMESLTRQMAFRGPDGLESTTRGHIGFGFARLSTGEAFAATDQPFTFDGRTYVVADARIDGRAELIKSLRKQCRDVAGDAPDAALILHAYLAWGRSCLERLIGDFAFAIWDANREHLFCARDHFGVKPFFYADLGGTFVFSNTLNVIRMHPGVSEALNELAIADFLLFGCNQELDTTALTDIRRLPPAHMLTFARGEVKQLKRYWTLPVDGVVRYRRQSEYVEHFKEIFCRAVADRLGGSRVAVLMSGGLDSTSVAVTAHHQSRKQQREFEIRLCTNVFDRLIPDNERRYARQVADTIGAPIHFESADDTELHGGWNRPGIMLPEPAESFDAAKVSDAKQKFLKNCRVMLTGFGGDPALAPPRAYVLQRILRGELAEVALGIWSCMKTHGRRPSLGIRTLIGDFVQRWRPESGMPGWLNSELVTRLDLKARWREKTGGHETGHRVRPEAHSSLSGLVWPHLFGVFDPGCNGEPVEYRHPFFDIRLVNFVLAMPRQPWFERKALLREAMKGILPDPVRLRPKTFLKGDPRIPVSPDFDKRCRDRLLSAPDLSFFVDKTAIPVHIWSEPALSSREYYGKDRAFSLGYWLNYCRPKPQDALARSVA